MLLFSLFWVLYLLFACCLSRSFFLFAVWIENILCNNIFWEEIVNFLKLWKDGIDLQIVLLAL